MDPGAPRFEIKLDGKSLTQLSLPYVMSVELKESMDEMDALNVTLALPESREDLVSLVRLAKSFEAILGYGDEVVRHVTGDIIGLTWRYDTKDVRVVTLEGLDRLYKLTQKKETKHWRKSHDEIAKEIARKHELTPKVQSVSVTAGHEFQSNESDAAFLHRLAKRHHYYVRVQNGELHFGRKTEHNRTLKLRWGQGLIDLQIQQSMHDIPTKVTVRGHDYKTNRPLSGVAGEGDLKNYSKGKSAVSVVKAYFGECPDEVDNAPLDTESACKAFAVSQLQERAEKFVQGTASCIGMPDAMSGIKVELEGVGPRSGIYLVRATEHVLDPSDGYRTTLTLCSDSLCPDDGAG